VRILQLMTVLGGGGAQRQLTYVSRELQARGHELCAGYFEPGFGSLPDDIPAHRLPYRNPWHPLQIVDILRLIRSWKPDVVHTWNLHMDVVGGLAAAAAGVPWVLREPTSPHNYDRFRARLRFFVARAAAKAVIANSPAGERYWRENAPGVQRVLVPNAVPVEAIESTTPLERGPGLRVGLFAGRFVTMKNVDVALRAFAEVMGEGDDVVLYLCGEGPERRNLIQLATRLGIRHAVHFTGFVSDVWRYLRAADFALLLSDFEGRPNVVTEAFAAGTPVILSDIPAHRELAAGGGATLVPLRDVAATARAIQEVLDDPQAARERATRARRLVAGCSVASVASAFEKIYSAACRASCQADVARTLKSTPERV